MVETLSRAAQTAEKNQVSRRQVPIKSAPGRNRTGDLALRRHSLYPLSYQGWGLVEERRIELPPCALLTRPPNI